MDDVTVSELRAQIDCLWDALRRMVYETTSASPMRVDGSHDCRISPFALEEARVALASTGKKPWPIETTHNWDYSTCPPEPDLPARDAANVAKGKREQLEFAATKAKAWLCSMALNADMDTMRERYGEEATGHARDLLNAASYEVADAIRAMIEVKP